MTVVSLSTAWTEQEPDQTAKEAIQRFGWSVLPLDEEKRPPKVGGAHTDGTPKRLAWKPLQKRRISVQEVARWQQQYDPTAWGVVTGAISKIIVLDFDGAAGKQTCEALGLRPHVQTGSGGWHVHLHHPGWSVPTLNSKTTNELGRRWPGLDIRADGGYAAFCGHNSNGSYIWLRDPEPEEITCLPDDLRAFLGLLHAPDAPSSETTELASRTLNQALLSRALHMVKTDHEGRNNTGFWLACQLRDNAYPKDTAKEIMQSYARHVPATNAKGQQDRYTLEEAYASLESAYQEAAREPWSSPVPLTQGSGRGTGGTVKIALSSPSEPEDLPDIVIGSDQLRDRTNLAIKAVLLQEHKHPTLFLQSARLVRISRDETKRPIIAQMGVNEVKEVLTHAANFFRLKKIAGSDLYEKSPTSPPKELAEQILARQTQKPYLPFPALAAVVETPVIRPDGTILDQPGYDKKTRLYYAPQEGMGACKVPVNPTQAEREAALALILEAIGEFPYVDDADKANALGLCITPLVRPAIKRHVPMALIDAPKPGSGKGLYSDVVSTIATGNSAAILTLADSEEELQKAITSLLIEGATIITIDNVSGRLQSKHIDAVLTSDTWHGRILGQSKMTNVPQRATWLATGNNIKIGGDLARRCYRIRLDPKVSRPWMRSGFKHNDLITWVADHRAELISALLTLARAWFVAGCPHYDHIPALGTFTGWSQMVGGILEYAGVSGFLSNLEKLYDEADEENAQWEVFFTSWATTLGHDWISTTNLGEKVTAARGSDGKESEPLAESLPESLQFALKEKPQSFNVRLGKALDKRVDECFGSENLRLEKTKDKHRNINQWRVLRGVAGIVPVTYGMKNSATFSAKTENNKSDRTNPRNPSQNEDSIDSGKTQIGSTSDFAHFPAPVEGANPSQSPHEPLAKSSKSKEYEI